MKVSKSYMQATVLVNTVFPRILAGPGRPILWSLWPQRAPCVWQLTMPYPCRCQLHIQPLATPSPLLLPLASSGQGAPKLFLAGYPKTLWAGPAYHIHSNKICILTSLELWPHIVGAEPILQLNHPPSPAQAKIIVLALSQLNCQQLGCSTKSWN